MAGQTNVPVLRVRDLTVEFATENGVVRAVDSVSFDVQSDETLGLVGESGCGKTVTGLSVLRLLPMPPGRITSGSIELQGRDLVPLENREIEDIRGRDISMIFQEPMTALNPVFTIASQMVDVLRRHRDLTRRQARSVAAELLAKVNIPAPETRLDDYPHQLSGGMRQRVMIAMALSCNPKLLIADEPTTALDVTTQAQVLEQISALQAEFRMAVILVTHDLGVVAETCRRALVMYCGSIVESGDTAELFSRPRHPYTAGLLASIPRIRSERLTELPVIPGRVPDLLHLPAGCRFADRCPRVQERCRVERPVLVGQAAAIAGGTAVACHFPL
ncbi:MAG: ABC transporter ATP-binding protein [Gammaproteobacteria bacterium]|nr:ABC transporter ATP-binding protein [Gammaproteobacteria bacterium]